MTSTLVERKSSNKQHIYSFGTTTTTTTTTWTCSFIILSLVCFMSYCYHFVNSSTATATAFAFFTAPVNQRHDFYYNTRKTTRTSVIQQTRPILFDKVIESSQLYRRSHSSSSSSSSSNQQSTSSVLYLFNKVFEENGPLGKGITVGKIQIALNTNDKTIFKVLEDCAKYGESNEQSGLAEMAHEICLTLIRKSDDWIGACSTSQWFKTSDGGKAESYYNTLANEEASKYEKEYIGNSNDEDTKKGYTSVVVSLIIELQGDQTKFDGAGYSFSETKDILSSIAADVLVDDGYCVNAMEAFWTPSDPNEETMTKMEMITDFPELLPL